MALWPPTPAAQALVFPRPNLSLILSLSFLQTKNPAYFSVSRVYKNLFLLLPAYLQSIRIDRDFTVSFGQTKAKHTTGLTMTCRSRD